MSLGLGLTAAAVIGVATPIAGWAAANSAPAMSNAAASSSAPASPSALATSTTPASANAPAVGASYDTTVTATVTPLTGLLTITAPGSTDLGIGAPGNIISAPWVGSVTVTDDRALLAASWTATASSTDFETGAGTSAETIPATHVTYDPGVITHTGILTTTGTLITLSNASIAPAGTLSPVPPAWGTTPRRGLRPRR